MIKTLKNTSKLLTLILAVVFSASVHSATEITEGFDWRLPSYAEQSTNGGMLGNYIATDDPEAPGAVLFVLWKESEAIRGKYNFERLEQSLKILDGRPALIRLEVNSRCHAPDWVDAEHSSTQSFKFWQDKYLEQLRGFVTAFADQFKNHEQVVGVHLGIADGEYYQYQDGFTRSDCPDIEIEYSQNSAYSPDTVFTYEVYDKFVNGGGRKGWGEFNWWHDGAAVNEEAIYINDGLTPKALKKSVKKIIDMYLKAFGEENAGKLVWMGFAPFGSDEYRDSIDSIYRYVKRKKLGNREGQIEAWMRYTGNIYGVDLVTELAPHASNEDGSCTMTFDERFADRIEGRYWGDENEFYGNLWYVANELGPLHNQPYRFYMSSMRALQLRKSHISINRAGHQYLRSLEGKYEYEYTPDGISTDLALQTQFNPASFITYLSKTLGRTRVDTPDAFIVLGEKTIRTSSGLYPAEYTENANNEDCLTAANSKGYTLVSDFGRWLSVVSKTEADLSMIKFMPNGESEGEPQEKRWGQILSVYRQFDQDGDGNTERVNYELYARKAKEMDVDINNKLMRERCRGSCDIQVKVVFKDDREMELQVIPTNGIASSVETAGGGQTRTATFDLNDFVAAGKNIPDFRIRTMDESDLSVLMIRVNFVSDNGTPQTPTIISPMSDAVINTKKATLKWAPVPGALRYRVSYNNNGTEISRYKKAEKFDCQSGECSFVSRKLKPGTSNWKVSSGNAAGESDWSSVQSFMVE